MSGFEIFLMINALAVGIIATLAVQHAIAHYRPEKIDKRHADDQTPHLTAGMKARLIGEAEDAFRKALDAQKQGFEKDLSSTAGMLTEQLHKIGAKIVNDELEGYKAALKDMHVQADEAINGGRKDIEAYKEEMKLKLAEELKAEKEKVLAQIDSKLSDAVLSFLLETLQHDVDLGAQTAYLTKMLDEHKDEFKKAVADEA